MKILVTGSAGFIGFHLCNLLSKKNKVIGLDNLNNYYSTKLKKDRLKELRKNKKFSFFNIDISNKKKLENIFIKNKIDVVINLAAQAGVRYSIENPDAYTNSNLIGFSNILEMCRVFKVKHLLAASTSSVYGDKRNLFLNETLNTDTPIQYYAATKKSNEVMAHSYSAMFDLKVSMLRFFTVYGPWGRPDMALFKFTKNILENKYIEVFNYGNHIRGFTYVDAISFAIDKLIKDNSKKKYQIYNIGGSESIKLMDFIKVLEKKLNKKAKIKFLKLQPGDIISTRASLKKINKFLVGYNEINIQKGISNFVEWYKSYYKV